MHKCCSTSPDLFTMSTVLIIYNGMAAPPLFKYIRLGQSSKPAKCEHGNAFAIPPHIFSATCASQRLDTSCRKDAPNIQTKVTENTPATLSSFPKYPSVSSAVPPTTLSLLSRHPGIKFRNQLVVRTRRISSRLEVADRPSN